MTSIYIYMSIYMSILFICCMRTKDVSGSRGRAPGRGIRGQSTPPPERETLSFWTFNGNRKFACFLIFGDAKNSVINNWSPSTFLLGGGREQSQEHGGQLRPPSGAAHGLYAHVTKRYFEPSSPHGHIAQRQTQLRTMTTQNRPRDLAISWVKHIWHTVPSLNDAI